MGTSSTENTREIQVSELDAIMERVEKGTQTPEDVASLKAVCTTLDILQRALKAKNISIERLKQIMFGASTETTENILGDSKRAASGKKPTDSGGAEKKKRKGHGRNGAAAYHGANRIPVKHATLKHGDCCPDCAKGKVYGEKEPSISIRITAVPPVTADKYERERLRCNGCGTVFTADAPPGVGAEKYDASVAAMIGLFKYGAGIPFHRLEKLQAGWGIPLPAGTQWQLVADAAEVLEGIFKELMRRSAQAEVLHNDDTTMRILEDEHRRAGV